MPIVLITFLTAYAVLLIFRQQVIADVVPVIIMCITIMVVSEMLMKLFEDDVIKIFQLKFSNKKFAKLDLDREFNTDAILFFYSIIYNVLVFHLTYQLYMGIYNGNIVLRLLLAIVLLIIFDIIFLYYCSKQVNEQGLEKTVTLYLYYESRFMNKGIIGMMLVIGVIMCLPLLFIGMLIAVIQWFV